MKSSLIATLKNLNFTEYEAKAYLTLLEDSPLTGYAVAKNSGVPRSKIYEILESMVARGDILISRATTPLYTPIPADTLLKNRRAQAEGNFRLAEEALKKFQQTKQNRESIWNIIGHSEIISKLKECIDSAKQRILVEIWEEDYLEVESELRRAAGRGVCITVVGYGTIASDFAEIYTHDMSRDITDEYGGRWIVFSSDDSNVLAGIVSLGENSRAAWTQHQGLVMPITEVIIHDLYILEIMGKHRLLLEDSFGKNLVALRRKFAIHPDFKKHYV